MPKLLFILIYCRSFFKRFILFGTSFLIPLASLVTLGVGVGFTMALVSNAFVQGVKFLTSTYENNEYPQIVLLLFASIQYLGYPENPQEALLKKDDF